MKYIDFLFNKIEFNALGNTEYGMKHIRYTDLKFYFYPKEKYI